MIRERKKIFVVGYVSGYVGAEGVDEENAKM